MPRQARRREASIKPQVLLGVDHLGPVVVESLGRIVIPDYGLGNDAASAPAVDNASDVRRSLPI